MILDYHLSLPAYMLAAATQVCPSPTLTQNEAQYLPLLKQEIGTSWPTAPWRSVFAAQIRQETCPSLKSKKCWSPYAELKTDREYGFGLGQITLTKSFDNFKEAKKLDSSLKEWSWGNRYNAVYQIRTMVLTDRFNYGRSAWAPDDKQRMSFTFAAYNGGMGGVLSDRAVCRGVQGCNPNVWFGHVEHTSKKAKVAKAGYGQSFFQINRGYVSHIMGEYRTRYLPYFEECVK